MKSPLVALLALVPAVGCSVQTRPAIDKKVRKLEAQCRKATEKATTDPGGALSDLREVEKAARGLAGTLLIGDPRRETVDRIIVEVGTMRRKIERERDGDEEARMKRTLEQQALGAIADGEDSGQKVEGRPEDIDMSAINAAVASMEVGGQRRAGVTRDADTDFDSPERSRRGGDKEGDIEEIEEEEKRRSDDKGSRPDQKAAYRKGVTVQKVVHRGKFVVVHLVFVSAMGATRVDSVTGELFDQKGNNAGYIMGAYLADGFEPNWEDVLSSRGTYITPQRAVTAQQDEPLFIVAVSESKKAKAARTARIDVATGGGRIIKGEGPKK
jgi:hypothetical protein